MAGSQIVGQSSDMAMLDQFPAGLRVLVVDDDPTWLRILEKMLHRCSYQVTTCSQASLALNILRERKGCFDVVLSDVYMPDMDGYKLLEHVGLEMDLPVIMMSGDGSTNAVMRGICHGACDYLIKPIREEELKNIWQHVVRKKWNENKELEHTSSIEDTDRHRRGNDDAEYGSAVTDGTEVMLKSQKKRSNFKDEDEIEMENDDPTTSKKARVVWSVELHQQFVSAVNQLGIDKAVPKRILELMNVPGLTRENVASHLQKFRLYLKRLSGVAQQQSGIPNTFCGPADPNVKMGSLGRLDIQALTASGQIPPQTLAALHAELLGRPTADLVFPPIDQPALLQASLQGSRCLPVEHGVSFGQPIAKCASNLPKQFQQSVFTAPEVPSSFGTWTSNNQSSIGKSSNIGGLGSQANSILIDMLHRRNQQQKQAYHQQTQAQPPIQPDTTRSINVQPSCLVVPSQSSATNHANNPAAINQNSTFNRDSVLDYGLLSRQSNTASSACGFSNEDPKSSDVLSSYSGQGSIPPSLSISSESAQTCSNYQVRSQCISHNGEGQITGFVPTLSNIQGSYVAKSGEVHNGGQLRNLRFISRGSLVPSRLAVDEFDSPLSNPTSGRIYVENDGTRVKQEPDFDYIDAKVGIPVMQNHSSNDLMSVFTD